MSGEASALEAELVELGGDQVEVIAARELRANPQDDLVDLVLVDACAGDVDAGAGLQVAADLVLERGRDAVVLAVSAPPSSELVLKALRAGVRDILGPGDAARIAEELRGLLTLAWAARRPRHHLRAGAAGLRRILGASPSFLTVCDRLSRAARTEVPVLLQGETGSGKEVAVRALHEEGARANGPFVAVNCMALPDSLLESELFGHAKGSFSDAHAPRTGLFRRANGGTLFLDEIGEMPALLQGKLLRALEERRIRPVGSDEEHPIDVRLVSASRVPLEDSVRAGHFREDLYYRLDVLRIDMPPLRERGLDVLLLARSFLQEACESSGREIEGLTAGATRCLLRYSWPGNIRELRNAIEQGVALCEGPSLDARDLPQAVRRATARELPDVGPEARPEMLETLEELERHHLARALRITGGNKAQAARRLGIDRSTLYRKLRRLGLVPGHQD